MSPISQPTFKPSATVDIDNATTNKISNITLAVLNTEISHILQTDLKQIMIRSRNKKDLKFSFVSGQSGTSYITIRAGAVYTREDLDFNGTLYIQSPSNNAEVEIEEWY